MLVPAVLDYRRSLVGVVLSCPRRGSESSLLALGAVDNPAASVGLVGVRVASGRTVRRISVSQMCSGSALVGSVQGCPVSAGSIDYVVALRGRMGSMVMEFSWLLCRPCLPSFP